MTDIYRQTYEALTPPALPSGWNHDAGFATVAGSLLVGTNSLSVTGTGAKSAFYATKDGKDGQVETRVRFLVNNPGTSSAVHVVGRLTDPVIANFGTSSSNSYRAEITLGSAAADWRLVRRVNGTDAAALLTGNVALKTALSAATAYEARLVTNGSTVAASGGTQVQLYVIRPDGQYLTSTGTWQATASACLSFTDVTAPISGLSGGYYGGFRADLAAGADANFDEFAVVDFIDLSNYVKTWSDDSGWTQGVGTIVPNFSGSSPGVSLPATSSTKTVATGFNDRLWGNESTWSAAWKASTFAAGCSILFRIGGYAFHIDTGVATITLRDTAFAAVGSTITFIPANWNATKFYRVIAFRTATAMKFAIRDQTTNNWLQPNGTFGTASVYCFAATLASPAPPGQTINFSNASTTGTAVLTVGTVEIGQAGVPAASPNPASVPLGGSLAITPARFDGVNTTGSATSGTYSGGVYGAPASGTSDTLTFSSTYGTGQSVAVPITLTSAVATSYTLTPPSPASGLTGVASGNFTLTPNGTSSAVVTITPSGGGLSAPFTVTFDGTASAKTFTITPPSAGTVTLTPTNGGGLTNPSAVTYTATALLSAVYVASNGSDSTTNGGSSSTPFLTITAARAAMVASGGTLNLRGGDTFSGQQIFTAGVTIQSYGTGRATLTNASNVLRFNDCDGITLINLVVVNTTTSSTAIFFYGTDGVRRSGGVSVTGCDVSGGVNCINFRCATGSAGGWNGVTITGNVIHDGTGIGVYLSDEGNAGTFKHYSNVLIEDNVVHDMGFCGIVLGNSDTTTGTGAARCVIRENYVYEIGLGNAGVAGPAGIFPIYADDVLVEKNLVRKVYTSTIGNDGCGLDADVDTTNCVFQYNECYDCEGAGFLQYQDSGSVNPNSGHVVRWNVFENCGTSSVAGLAGIRLTSPGSCTIYQNTVIAKGATNGAVYTTNAANKKIYNNLLISAPGVPTIDINGSTTGLSLQGNAYQAGPGTCLLRYAGTNYSSLATFRSASGQESGTRGFITTNPFVGYGTTAPAPTDPSAMAATVGTYYDPAPGSPISLAGLNLLSLFAIDPGTLDFKGSTIPTPYSIGAVGTAAAAAAGNTLLNYFGQAQSGGLLVMGV